MNEQEFIKLKADCEVYKMKVDKLEMLCVKLQDKVANLETKSEKTDFQYEQIMKMLNKLNEQTIPGLSAEIQALKEKPIKRYDAIISSIITGIIGIVLGFIGSRIFP